MKVLAISPHTDDAELGCGGTLQKYEDVTLVAFSPCHSQELTEECRRSTFLLGIKETLIYGFENRIFPENRQEILDRMIQLKAKYFPDIVFVPMTGDVHQDHEVITAEAIRAFKHTTILGYELPWNHVQHPSRVNCFSSITAEQLKKKVQALGRYSTQQHRAYMNSNFITSLATVRGVQANCQYAEAFQTIRSFIP